MTMLRATETAPPPLVHRPDAGIDSVHRPIGGHTGDTGQFLGRAGVLQDSLFLALVVVLSFVPYVHRVGFYSDYWTFLFELALSADQSPIGLFRSLALAIAP